MCDIMMLVKCQIAPPTVHVRLSCWRTGTKQKNRHQVQKGCPTITCTMENLNQNNMASSASGACLSMS